MVTARKRFDAARAAALKAQARSRPRNPQAIISGPGTLARLACRRLVPGEQPGAGEWRGRAHEHQLAEAAVL